MDSRSHRSAPLRGALIVVRGLAGSGKTDLLHALAAAGEQTLDLEGLARHRGGAFGGVGGRRQPSGEEFVAAVTGVVERAAPERPLWVEDELPYLGSVSLPPWLVAAMAVAPVVELRAPAEARVDRLLASYGQLPRTGLERALRRVAPRLGPARAAAAAHAVRAGRVRDAIAAVLPYYDAGYRHRAGRDARRVLVEIAAERDLGAVAAALAEDHGASPPR